jgi:hypothetical protein
MRSLVLHFQVSRHGSSWFFQHPLEKKNTATALFHPFANRFFGFWHPAARCHTLWLGMLFHDVHVSTRHGQTHREMCVVSICVQDVHQGTGARELGSAVRIIGHRDAAAVAEVAPLTETWRDVTGVSGIFLGAKNLMQVKNKSVIRFFGDSSDTFLGPPL